MELRKSRRYRLSAPAFFCWESSSGTLQDGKGQTHDISVTGAFVTTETAPPWGARLELIVYLPSLQGTGNAVQLRSEGRVTRVVQESDPKGFAAEVIFQSETSDEPTILNSNKSQ